VTAELALERSGPERFLSTFLLLREFAIYTAAEPGEIRQVALGALVARLLSLRELSQRVAAALDFGEIPDVAAALVKDLGTNFEVDSVDDIRGACGIAPAASSGDPFGRMLAMAQLHAPAFTLRGGTNEILRSIVARGLGMRG
jgi:alkylation response protein AidB-like acyl-CoA dehydrogenase